MRLEGIEVKEDQPIIPQPGYLSWMQQLAGYGSILSEEGLVVYKWDVGTQNPSGRYLCSRATTRLCTARVPHGPGLFTIQSNQHPFGLTTHLSLNG